MPVWRKDVISSFGLRINYYYDCIFRRAFQTYISKTHGSPQFPVADSASIICIIFKESFIFNIV